jgi:hypothetical protein
MPTKRSINAKNVELSTGLFKSLGRLRLGKIVVAGVLAFAGLMTVGVGVSNAATLQTEGTYPTQAACYAAGPGVEATTAGNWNNFWCVPDRNDLNTWRLVLTN